MSKPKRIFIVGRMGSGKGLLAQALAKKLGWQFVDANLSLERIIGRTLNEILGAEGEAHFHECEAEILAQCKGKENIVVTTNDGMVATEKNRQLLASEFVIYLKISNETQLERMSYDLSTLLPITDQKEFIDKLNRAYDSQFEQVAKLTIDSKFVNGLNETIEADVNAIMKVLEA